MSDLQVLHDYSAGSVELVPKVKFSRKDFTRIPIYSLFRLLVHFSSPSLAVVRVPLFNSFKSVSTDIYFPEFFVFQCLVKEDCIPQWNDVFSILSVCDLIVSDELVAEFRVKDIGNLINQIVSVSLPCNYINH